MKKKIGRFLFIALLLALCFTLPVNAAAKFKKLSSNKRGAVKVSSAFIYEKNSGKSKTLQKLKFGDKVQLRAQSGNWYEVKKGSVKGFMKNNSIVMYDKTKKHIALTFDDGPSQKTTTKVINALKKNKCRATFFVVGSNINKRTGALLKKEAELGCEIGNHSYSHPQLTYLGSSQVKSQFSKTNKKIKQYTGKKATLCRTPYGAYNARVLSQAGTPHILWSVDTLDWKYRDTRRLVSYVNKNAKNGAIVLMHDIHNTTANAVNDICKNLKKKGFETVTVTELAAIKGKKLKSGYTYSRF